MASPNDDNNQWPTFGSFNNPWMTPGSAGASGPRSISNRHSEEYAFLIKSIESLKAENRKKDKDIEDLRKQVAKSKEAAKAVTDEFVSKTKGQEEEVAKLGKDIATLKADSVAAAEEIKQQKSELKSDRLQSIQILAIFVAFFTFTSISFQMFANVNKAYWMPLGLLILGGVVIFAAITSLLLSASKTSKISMAIAGGLVAIAVFFVIGGAVLYGQALSTEESREDACWSLTKQIQQEGISEKAQIALQAQHEARCLPETK